MKTNAISWNPMEAFNFTTVCVPYLCHAWKIHMVNWSEDTTFNRLMKTKTATHKNERSIEYHVLAVYVHFDRLIRIFGCFSNFQS